MRIARASLLAFGLSLSLSFTTASAVDLNPSTHSAVPADFNGDGRVDALLQPLQATGGGAILLQDGTGSLSVVAQSWEPGYLGLDWSTAKSRITAADLNGDGQDDVIVQPTSSGGTAAVLITDPSQQILQIAQLLPAGYLGQDWSSASHLVAGDFDGDRRKELLLQAAGPGQVSAIVHADEAGHVAALIQSLPDGYLGRRWNAQAVTLYVGDLNGDGRQDLLIQVNPGATQAGESSYALLLADPDGRFTHLNEVWNDSDFGGDWSPATHTLSLQDLNHTGVMDVVLTSKTLGGSNYVFEPNAQGQFTQPAVRWTGPETAQQALARRTPSSGTGISVTTAPVVKAATLTSASATTATTTQSQPLVQQAQTAGVNTQDTAGTLEGSAGVSGGAATYTIPIVVPPGRAGMQPSLALAYSSRGGNSEMGVGWSLSGLSAITRCPATYAQDGYSRGVSYDYNDRFCLDGQHLMLQSGSYGKSGSSYRTELESFARIDLSGDSLSGTSSFTVHYKDGRIATYNNPFTPPGAAGPLEWQISWEQDRANNAVVYQYDQSVATESLISEIDYTGTVANGAATIGSRKVTFFYAGRPDASSSYLAGGKSTQTRLLNTIYTNENGSTVRSYSLNYGVSSSTQRSLLTSVLGCGFGTDGTQHCFNQATAFAWRNPPLSYGDPNAAVPYAPMPITGFAGVDVSQPNLTTDQLEPTIAIAGDYDGDGRRELILSRDSTDSTPSGTYLEFMGAGNQVASETDIGSFVSQYGLNTDATSIQNVGSKDINNDGAADILVKDGFYFGVASWNGSKFVVNPTNVQYLNTQVVVADINGDGKNDILREVQGDGTDGCGTGDDCLFFYPNKVPQSLTFGSRQLVADLTSLGLPRFSQGETFHMAGDWNGDGTPDILIQPAGGSRIDQVLISQMSPTGVTFAAHTLDSLNIDSSLMTSASHYFLDINGDGLPDFVYVEVSTGKWWYQLNTGKLGNAMFAAPVWTGAYDDRTNIGGWTPQGTAADLSLPPIAGTLQGDFDNDGSEELIFPKTRMVGFCPVEQVTYEGNKVNTNVCPGPAPSGPNGPVDSSLYSLDGVAPQDDFSIFKYGLLKWVLTASGTYTVQEEDPNITAQVNLAVVGDLQGDGLTDVISLFSRHWHDALFESSDYEPIAKCPGQYGCGFLVASNTVTATDTTGNRENAAPDMMSSATNGLGLVSKWDYFPLSTGFNNLYFVPTLGDPRRYAGDDYFYFQSSMYVVGDFAEMNGVGGYTTHDFHYGEAIYNSQGRGFQGFRVVVDDNMTLGTRNEQVYHQRFPLSGQLAESFVTTQATLDLDDPQPDSNAVDDVVNTAACYVSSNSRKFVGGSFTVDPYDSHQKNNDDVTCTVLLDAPGYWPYVSESVEKKYDTAQVLLSTTDSTMNYDAFGNYTTGTATVTDATGVYEKDTTDNYLPVDESSNWWLDQLQSKTVTDKATYNPLPNGDALPASNITTNTSYTFNQTTHLPTQVDELPGTPYERITTYGYTDGYGNVNSVTVTSGAADPQQVSRVTKTDFTTDPGNQGYFPAKLTDAAGHVTQVVPYPQFGKPATSTDPNGVVTTFGYDAFGRIASTQVTSPIALSTRRVTYEASDSDCPSTAAEAIVTSQAGQPTKKGCLDLLGRSVRSVTEGFSTLGAHIYQDTAFDKFGTVTKTTEPYYSGDSNIQNDSNTYFPDILRRVQTRTTPKSSTGYSYDGLVTHITTTTPGDPNNPNYTREDDEYRNALGKVLSITNGKGSGGTTESTNEYGFDAHGNPVYIKDNAGNVITTAYNPLDQKEEVYDPDQGQSSYQYDVLGNLVSQITADERALGQTTTFGYDKLGRMTSKAAPEGATTWTYDSCTNGIGRLCNVSQYDGYQETYAYDGDSRPISTDEKIGGSDYITTTDYDGYGRVADVTYPATIANATPTASAGANQTVPPNTAVTLAGTVADADNGPLPLSSQWTQTSGPTVTLSGANTPTATFTTLAPGDTYVFTLTVNDGLSSATSSVTVSVPPLPATPGKPTFTDGNNQTLNGLTLSGVYNVNWPAVTVTGQTIDYHLEMATGTSTTPGTFQEITPKVPKGITATTWPEDHSNNASYYYWYRVRSHDLSGYSVDYSSNSVIHVVVTPSPTPTLSPGGINVGTVNTPYTLSWTAAGPKVSYYALQESKNDNTFASPTTVYQGTGRSWSTTKTVTTNEFYYRVKACNSSDGTTTCTAWSNVSHWAINNPNGGGGGQLQAQPVGTTTTTSAPSPTTTTAPSPTTTTTAPAPVSGAPTAGMSPGPTAMIAVPKAISDLALGETGGLYAHAGDLGIRSSGEAASLQGLVRAAGSQAQKLAGTASPENPHLAYARPRFAKPVYQAYADARLQPATSTAPLVGITVHYVYSGNGYLSALTNAYSGLTYWSVDRSNGAYVDASGNSSQYGMDARGNVTDSVYGNGISSHYGYDPATGYLLKLQSGTSLGSTNRQNLSYTWQSLGNLMQRQDLNQNLTEGFTYDVLNRLSTETLTNGGGTQNVNYAYDALGNLKCKSDVTGPTCTPASNGYTYGGNAGPHAVTSVIGTVNGIANPSYGYDSDGNVTNRAGTAVDWNSDDLPTCADTTAGLTDCDPAHPNYSQFSYAPDKHRYFQSANVHGQSETTIYVGALEIVNDATGIHNRYNLSAYGRSVAVIDLESTATGRPVLNAQYLLTDHLGSVDVATDASGNVVAGTGFSFEAFGQRRDPSTWQVPANSAQVDMDRSSSTSNGMSTPSGVTHRGFTGHEMLDNVNLIHMNGRVYDPTIGRFLSVDPLFQFPTNTQSLNPYSYVLNNPLSNTDPTGYSCDVSESVSACGDSLKAGETTQIKQDVTGSHIKQDVGTVGKDKDGNVYVTKGNGADVKQAMSAVNNLKQMGDPAFINSPSTRENTAQPGGSAPAACQTSVNCKGVGDQAFSGDGSHHYDMQNTICSKSTSGCTGSNVFQSNLKNDYPGSDGQTPVKNLGQYAVLYPAGSITTIVEPQLNRVINWTNDDHIFYKGLVIRSTVETNSTISIRTYGEGINQPKMWWMPNAVSRGLNNMLYRPTWNLMDRRIRTDILSRSPQGQAELEGDAARQDVQSINSMPPQY